MRESQFTASLSKELQALGVYTLKNSNQYTGGVPDCWYSSGRDLWTEHKFFSTLPPVIDLTKESITTPLQQNWLRARHGEGRPVGMIVGHYTRGMRSSCGIFLPGLTWEQPISRDEFRARMLNKKKLAEELAEYLGQPVERC